MATGTLIPWFEEQFCDDNGNPLNAGTVLTQLAGTTTNVATYTTAALSVANANPVVLNSAGRPSSGGTEVGIFLTPGVSYKFTLKNSSGVTIRTIDNVVATPTSSANLNVDGTAGEGITAGQVVYLSDGSGSKTAGQWFLADADNTYSSLTPEIGIAPNAISISTSGTIATGGRVTGLSGLTIGALYYVSGTAGALTATAPTNARLVGQADSATSIVLAPNPSSPSMLDNSICDGRLTLTTALPVTTADVTAAASVFFTPYRGNRIALFDGTAWNVRTFSEITIALGTITSALPYDIFAYDNAGAVACDAPVAWTNTTTRATALTLQNGVLSKTGATTRRYLGTFVTTSTTTTEDSAAKRYLWNCYNRVPRPMKRFETTNSWTYITSAWRQTNGAAANQLDCVIGVSECPVFVTMTAMWTNSNAGVVVGVGIGIDSTSTPSSNFSGGSMSSGPGNIYVPVTVTGQAYPGVGRHVFVGLENGFGPAGSTWYGAGGLAAGITEWGMTGWIEG